MEAVQGVIGMTNLAYLIRLKVVFFVSTERKRGKVLISCKIQQITFGEGKITLRHDFLCKSSNTSLSQPCRAGENAQVGNSPVAGEGHFKWTVLKVHMGSGREFFVVLVFTQ